MPVRIRLQRHGKKGKPFYWIVAADARAKRDGKFLEKLGTYNPNTEPATIELDVDHSVNWLQNGAQPTHTARRILSYKGVMLKHHLLGGVAKGALTEEEAQKKFEAWLKDKELAISNKAKSIETAKAKAREEALQAEKEANEKRALAAVAEEVEEEAAVAEASAEAAADTSEAVEAAEETESSASEEAPAKEAAPEAEAKTEVAEAIEEAPAEEAAPEAEAKVEETPAEEAAAEAETKAEESTPEASATEEEAEASSEEE